MIDTAIVERRDWAAGLMTLTLAERPTFRPGQFMNLGLYLPSGFVSRSYSVASAPGAPLEFLLSRVGEGVLTPALFALRVGGTLQLDPKPQGFFTFDYVPPHREQWMLGTGTGLGPFLSMLRSGEAFERAEKVVLALGARGPDELAHRQELEALVAAHEGRFRFVPSLSRAPAPFALHGRVTQTLASGELEQRAGLEISSDRSHVLLCGNPGMIEQVTVQLAARGLRKHRQRVPGQISSEKYW